MTGTVLSGKNACTSSSSDLLLSSLREKLCFHNNGLLRKTSFAENLKVTLFSHVQYWSHVRLVLVSNTDVLGDKCPDFVQVDGRAVELVVGLVKISHSNLPEVSRMVLVKVDAMMMLASSVTTSTSCRF